MNDRTRQLEALLFGKPDKIPLTPGGGRKSTRETWRKQGLPDSVKDGDIVEYAYRQAGGKLDWPKGGKGFYADARMIPQFEEKVIERKENSQVVQDWKGNICEIGNEFTVDYLRNAMDFVTRRWIKCPVETRTDWEDMKRRYNPNDLHRYSENPVVLGKELQNREHYVGLNFSGPFWQLREWLGFENLCMMFYDDPGFLKEMILFWQEYVSALLKNAFKYFTPDEVHLSEDMAYKSFSMVSPDMAREYLLPTWIKWGEIIRGAGVPVYAMDSDGFIGELIPLWIEAGINACDPIEVAAGNDIVAFRKRFGKNMAYRGGVDKRAMAKGGRVIEEEMRRIEPVIRDGGFIPSCDHGVPSDVSWDNYVYYINLLSKTTGWM
jgi:uroporphyrinogen decarboxylase